MQYNCKPVDKSLAMAINSVLPIIKDKACMKSLGPLRELFPKMINEPTKIMRVAQVCKGNCGDAAMCDRLSNIFQCLFTSLMREDVPWNEVSTSWLVGQATASPGFVALCQVKKQIMEFMFRAVHLAVDHQELQQSSEVIINKVLPKFQTPMDSHTA